jgi:hypothetical protein
MPTLSEDVLSRYHRFSLYNSPYVAHDNGSAIDLYPNTDDACDIAPSPVAGEILDVQTVRAPSKEYAAVHDHLILIDTGEYVARVLHVDPAVEPGETVAVGDSLGTLVRAGFFAPWVDNHIHLGFRRSDANPYRASGSLAIDVDVPIESLPWDGTGHVVATGDTYAVLDAPTHPAPGEHFVGIECGNAVLDGGCPHYDGGGLLIADSDSNSSRASDRAEVTLVGSRIGSASGRNVRWDDIEIRANGTRITGISFFLAQDVAFGAKLICPDVMFEAGEFVEISVHSDSPEQSC